MYRVIKRGAAVRSEDVVVIPDAPDKQPDSADDEEPSEKEEEKQEPPQIDIQQTIRAAREEAEAIARRLLEDAGAERDSILRQVNDEAQKVLQQAQDEGYEAGCRKAADDAAAAIGELKELIAELERQQREYLEQYARELKYLSIDIARKIIGNSMEVVGEGALTDLVRQAVNSVKGADWMTVELSSRLEGLVRTLFKDFASRSAKHIEITVKDAPADHCVIKTNVGNIDASVSTQLENLRAMFKDMDDFGREDVF